MVLESGWLVWPCDIIGGQSMGLMFDIEKYQYKHFCSTHIFSGNYHATRFGFYQAYYVSYFLVSDLLGLIMARNCYRAMMNMVHVLVPYNTVIGSMLLYQYWFTLALLSHSVCHLKKKFPRFFKYCNNVPRGGIT